MDAAEYNITIHRGGTWSRRMTLSVNDVDLDLSTYSARMKIRRTYGSAVILSLTESSGITLAAVSPNIIVTITDEQTAAFDFVYAVYDLEIESPDGAVDPLLYGRITLRKEVTV